MVFLEVRKIDPDRGATPEVLRHRAVVLRGAVADVGRKVGGDGGAVEGRRPDELVAFLEIRAAFVPQQFERPLRDRHRPGETGQHRVLVAEMPQHLRKLVEELRFLVGMDRDLLIEQPAEDFVAFLELPPVAFRTVGLRMNQ